MNLDILQNYLLSKISEPAPRFLFVIDKSNILSGITDLLIGATLYEVIYYENDLQLRAALEWQKDHLSDDHYCIISQQSDADNLATMDYIQRSQFIQVSPQVLLNFVGKGYWSEAANWLKGNDFWRSLDTLVRIKDKPHLTPLDQDQVYLTSTLLNIDFSQRFDPATAFIFYFRKMKTTRFQNFEHNYPHLAKYVREKLFTDVPELRQFSQQPELLRDFWLGRYDQVHPQFGDAETAEDIKHQLTIKAPFLVRDQIQNFEKSYFDQPDKINTFIKSNLIADNWQGWLEYVRRENFLVEPLKLIITKVVDHLVRQYEYVDLMQLIDTMESLNDHLLIRLSGKQSNIEAEPDFQFFHSFRLIVQIYQHIRQIKQAVAHDRFHFQEMIHQLYPQWLAPLPRLLDQLEIQQQRHQFWNESIVKKITHDVNAIRTQAQHLFIKWLERNYSFSIDKLIRWSGGTNYPFQIVTHFLENNPNEQILILLFDSMRWDSWEWLKPHLQPLFPHREMLVNPILMPLPTTTHYCRPFVLNGKMTPTSNGITTVNSLNSDSLAVYLHNDSPNARLAFEEWLHSDRPIKLLIFNIFDQRVHHANLGLQALYQEIETEFTQDLIPLLNRISPPSKIIICTDHGFIQVSGKYRLNDDYAQPSEIPPQHRRFIHLNAVQADKQKLLFFQMERLGLTGETNQGLAFLKTFEVFKLSVSEAYVRYAHGGVSLEEMVVPVVIFE